MSADSFTFSPPIRLYSCDAVKSLDHLAIEKHGIPGIVLMKRAGLAIFSALQSRWPKTERLLVLCGGGNNGGDGYIVAGLAKDKGLSVKVYAVTPPHKLSGDAERAYQFAVQAGVEILTFPKCETVDVVLPASTVIIDAMLGIGLKGPVKPGLSQAIKWVNGSGLPIVSVDLPSGLNGDTGAIDDISIKADATVTFIGRKLGLFTGQGPSVAGDICYEQLGVPGAAFDSVDALAKIAVIRVSDALPPRARAAFKNNFGHVMVVGGDAGMGGAAMLCAEAAGRSGAGLVSLATQTMHLPAALARLPEIMVLGIPSGQELEPHLNRPSVIAVGPGLGSSPWSEQLLQQVLTKIEAGIPAVIDADALNLLAKQKLSLPKNKKHWVLTPHSGEAARLLNCMAQDIEADRPAAVKKLQQAYGGVVVLKGAGSLVYDGETLFLINDGNPGMATGGCGDVLTGVIAALLAQGLSPPQAAVLGATVHAQAGDEAAKNGQRGLMASDLMTPLRALINV